MGADAVADGLAVASLGRTGLWPFTAAALVPSLPGELAALTAAGFQHGVHGHR